MIFISEYVYDNFLLNETRNIVENTPIEFELKYGFNYNSVVKVDCVT